MVIEVAGLAQHRQVRNVCEAVVFEVVDVMGVAALGVSGACDAAAITNRQHNSLVRSQLQTLARPNLDGTDCVTCVLHYAASTAGSVASHRFSSDAGTAIGRSACTHSWTASPKMARVGLGVAGGVRNCSRRTQ